jgi:hypothetical protein
MSQQFKNIFAMNGVEDDSFQRHPDFTIQDTKPKSAWDAFLKVRQTQAKVIPTLQEIQARDKRLVKAQANYNRWRSQLWEDDNNL